MDILSASVDVIRRAWVDAFWPVPEAEIEIGDVVIAHHEVSTVDPGKLLIQLRPSICFGQGRHATTQLCIHALADTDLAGRKVLDFGTGSGILGIVAAMRGADSVIAIDNYLPSIQVAVANIHLNHLGGQVNIVRGSIMEAVEHGPYNLIVANILWQDLEPLLPDLVGILERPGKLILSGIHVTEAALFYEMVNRMNPNLVVPMSKDGWACCSILLTGGSDD